MQTIDNSWTVTIPAYLQLLAAGGRSHGTIKNRRHYLTSAAASIPTPADLTTDNVARWLTDNDWKPETTRSARAAIRGYAHWAIKMRLIDEDPLEAIPAPKVPLKQSHPAPDKVIMLSAEKAAPREALMIRIGATLGLRACEICKIHERDWDGRELEVVGKGGVTRYVPVTDGALIYQFNHMTGWLFPGRIDGHLSPGTVSKLLSHALLDPKVTAHKLRHRFATQAFDGSADIVAVSELLGHAKITTTQIYIRPNAKSKLRAVESAKLAA